MKLELKENITLMLSVINLCISVAVLLILGKSYERRG